MRIVQFADSHIGTTFGGKGFERHVRKIQELNPDIVLIVGDLWMMVRRVKKWFRRAGRWERLKRSMAFILLLAIMTKGIMLRKSEVLPETS